MLSPAFSTLSTGLTMGTERVQRAMATWPNAFSTLSTGLTMGTWRRTVALLPEARFQYPIHGSDHGNSLGACTMSRTSSPFSTLSTGLTMGTELYSGFERSAGYLSVPYPRV